MGMFEAGERQSEVVEPMIERLSFFETFQ